MNTIDIYIINKKYYLTITFLYEVNNIFNYVNKFV